MQVILFDGVCNLCNASVNWVIDRDKKNIFHFASLQSGYGIKTVQEFGLSGDYLDTVILREADKIYTRSDAILRIAKLLGGGYSFLYVFRIIPRFMRDAVYNFIARNRYRWFGKKESCRVPSPELKAKFLD